MLSQMQLDSNNATLGCALTYPLGVVGVILGIIAVRKLFARPSDIPQPDAEHKKNIFIVEFKISNPGVVGKSIQPPPFRHLPPLACRAGFDSDFGLDPRIG